MVINYEQIEYIICKAIKLDYCLLIYIRTIPEVWRPDITNIMAITYHIVGEKGC